MCPVVMLKRRQIAPPMKNLEPSLSIDNRDTTPQRTMHQTDRQGIAQHNTPINITLGPCGVTTNHHSAIGYSPYAAVVQSSNPRQNSPDDAPVMMAVFFEPPAAIVVASLEAAPAVGTTVATDRVRAEKSIAPGVKHPGARDTELVVASSLR